MNTIVRIGCAAALLLSMATSAWAKPWVNNEIGRIHWGMPYLPQFATILPAVYESCRLVASTSVISKIPGLEHHGLTVAVCDGRGHAWLSKFVPDSDIKDSTGHWEVVDFLSTGTLRKGENMFSPFCSVNKSHHHFDWIAVYRGDRKKYTHQNGGIAQGWVINPSTKRFELAPPQMLKKMVCIPENYD